MNHMRSIVKQKSGFLLDFDQTSWTTGGYVYGADMYWTEKADKLIAERGLSYRYIGSRDKDISENYVSGAIRNRRDISVSKGIKLAKILNVPADWLFDDEQDWPPPTVIPKNAIDRIDALELSYAHGKRVLDSVLQELDRLHESMKNSAVRTPQAG